MTWKRIGVLVALVVAFLGIVGATGAGLPQQIALPGLPEIALPQPVAPVDQTGEEGAGQNQSDGQSPTSDQATRVKTNQDEERPNPADPSAIVTDRRALVLLNPATVTAGGTVSVSGSGFEPGATVTVFLKRDKSDKGVDLGFVQADQGGSFGGFSFRLPDELAGRSFLVVARQQGGKAIEATAQGNAAASSPEIKFGTQVGKPGDNVTFSAKGFAPGEEVRVHFNSLSSDPVQKFKVDQGGGLRQATIRVPFGAVGNNSFIFIGEKSQSPVTVPFLMLSLYPNAAVSAYAAKADTVLTFSGKGFGPNERVSVHLNSPTAPPVAVFETDDEGSFADAGAFLIPFNLQGKNTFILLGEKSQAAATVSFDVLPYAPYAEPSTYGGRPGTTITFYGSGFAREEIVRVYAGATRDNPGREVACFKADNQGNVRGGGSYTVPANAQRGTLNFRLVGDKSRGVATAAIEVMEAGGPLQTQVQEQPFKCPYDEGGEGQSPAGQPGPQPQPAPATPPANQSQSGGGNRQRP